MARSAKKRRISRRVGQFRAERRLILLAILGTIVFAGWSWLQAHPEHNPLAPLDLRDPIGKASATKLLALRDDVAECRAVLERSEVAFVALDPAGEGACARPDRTQLTSYPIAPSSPPVTCPVAAAMELWRARTLEPAAREIFGIDLQRIEHLGAYSCRRLYGRAEGAWSQHATANAIDIAGFTLGDGTRISVLDDWDGDDAKARFLETARDGACEVFATVLSPEYNAAHADHFHFDQGGRWMGVCR
ncbi:MAG: extensin family protein [Erythrobacter sp.]|jgi:hypothetical protein|nr:extensin family protein [Erythrobacter sp.]